MFWKNKKDPHWDLKKLSDEDLENLTFIELQRIRNKRWAYELHDLKDRAQAEIDRRNPLRDWKCTGCGKVKYHEKEMRVSGGFFESFLGIEHSKYHAIICNYCGKAEFYNVLMSSSEKGFGFLGN